MSGRVRARVGAGAGDLGALFALFMRERGEINGRLILTSKGKSTWNVRVD